jgi:oligosaccharide repeat unit polymerase
MMEGQDAGLDILIASLAIFALANYRLRRSVLYPPFLFCAMWLLDAIVYRLHLIDINPLHPITMYVIAAGAILFSLGGLCAFLAPETMIATRLTIIGRPKIAASWLKYLIVLFLAVCVCFAIHAMMVVAAGAGGVGGLFFAVARETVIENINEGHESIPWYSYAATWTIFAATLFQTERRDRVSWIAAAIAFVSCVISGGRGGFLFLFSSLICVYLIKATRERFAVAMRFARWPIAGFFLLFAGLLFVDKNISTTTDVLTFAGRSVVSYIVGPVAALDQVLLHPFDYAGAPNHTFRFFLQIGSWLGLVSYTPAPGLDKFIFVPFGTNVYTAYKFFITDYGMWSSLAIMGLIGFLHTLLFRKAHSGSVLGLYLFALTIYPTLMVIFDDQYSQFGLYVDALVFAAAYLTIKSIPWRIFKIKSDQYASRPLTLQDKKPKLATPDVGRMSRSET